MKNNLQSSALSSSLFCPSPKGFTLLEVMIAMVIAVAGISLVWMSFANIAQATTRGEMMLETLHHGEYAMDQLVSAMRSASFFSHEPKNYEFILEDEGGGNSPKDIVSWVTSSSAFMPIGSPLANGLHRIYVSIEDGDDGEPALAVVAYPHMLDPEDDEVEEIDFWIVSKKIRGLDCRVYERDTDSWEEDWDHEKTVPRFVEFTLVIDPVEENGNPTELTRMVEVPIGIYTMKRGYQDDEGVEGEEGGFDTEVPGGDI